MEKTVNMNEVSRISAGTLFKGDIYTTGDVRIDGRFEGKLVTSGRVVVGEKCEQHGDIICENADFYGTLQGNFYVRDVLTLRSTCKVNGMFYAKRLQVELDAALNGTFRTITEEEFAAVAKKQGIEGMPPMDFTTTTGKPIEASATPLPSEAQESKPAGGEKQKNLDKK